MNVAQGLSIALAIFALSIVGTAVLIVAPILSDWFFMNTIHWPQADLAYKCRDAGGTNLDRNGSCWKTYNACLEEPCTPYTPLVEVKQRMKQEDWYYG